MNYPDIKIIAHRGHGPTSTLSGSGNLVPDYLAPENTLKAFREAVRQDADGIEFDVYMSADGHPVIIHDDELNKNVEGADREGSELGRVSEKTLAELKLFNVGQGEAIPSLKEVLDFFAQTNADRKEIGKAPLIINIELKGSDTGEKTASLIRTYINKGTLHADDVVFCSFDHDALIAVKEKNQDFKIAPNLKTMFLFGKNNLVMPGWYVKEGATYDNEALNHLRHMHRSVGCHALDPVLWDVYHPLVEFAKEEGLALFISTSDLRTFKREHLIGLLAIAKSGVPISFKTDEPAMAKAVLKELWQTQQQALHTPIHEMSTALVIETEKEAGSPASRFRDAQISLLKKILGRPPGPLLLIRERRRNHPVSRGCDAASLWKRRNLVRV